MSPLPLILWGFPFKKRGIPTSAGMCFRRSRKRNVTSHLRARSRVVGLSSSREGFAGRLRRFNACQALDTVSDEVPVFRRDLGQPREISLCTCCEIRLNRRQ